MNQGFVCHSGRHYYPAPSDTGAERHCCSSFRLGDRDGLLAEKKSLEDQIKQVEKNIVAARTELETLKSTAGKLESNLTDTKAKRQATLASGSLPGADASLGSMPGDIETMRSIIADKSGQINALTNNSSSIRERLTSVDRELARFELHAQADAVHQEMQRVLREWNEQVRKILAIRKAAEVHGLPPGDLNFGEYPIFPIGVSNPGWNANPEQLIELLGLRPTLNFDMAGDRITARD